VSDNKQHSDPFLFQLVQQFLEADDDQSADAEGLTDKELYSMFALIICVSAILALTIGPFSLLR
jgi:hypothetical protein